MAKFKEEISGKQPTITHRFIEAMAQAGVLIRLYTQNIDCLELKLDMSPQGNSSSMVSGGASRSGKKKILFPFLNHIFRHWHVRI